MGQSVHSADSCRDMAAYYRAVLYGQDWNPEAPVGGLTFSLKDMADNARPQVSNMKALTIARCREPSEGDRRLSVFLCKEFPKTTKLKARPFWKLARASELLYSPISLWQKKVAFLPLKLNKLNKLNKFKITLRKINVKAANGD